MLFDAVEPRALNYASGRAQITREGDGLVVVFPPAESAASFWIGVTTAFVLSISCLVGAFWPAGTTHVGGMTVSHPSGVKVRVVSLAIAAGSAACCWYTVRNRIIRSTLELRGTTLTYRRPGMRGMRKDEYDLAHFVDVDVMESDDRETVYLCLRRATDGPSDAPPGGIAARPSTKAEEADLEMVADALRRAAWPERAAARTRRSTFTRTGPDAIESDKGFAVRLPDPGRVEYSEDGKTMSLRVERGWSTDQAMCFVFGRDALCRWDGAPPDVTLPPDTQREILHNLSEALREWGVRVLVGGGSGAIGETDAHVSARLRSGE